MGHTFFAISTGPSDSRFLTQEAILALQKCRTVFYPSTLKSNASHIAFDAIYEFIDEKKTDCVPVNFSMSGNLSETSSEYGNIIHRITKALGQGDVGFISIGDVSIYSTAARMASLIEQKGFNAFFIPGVTSFCAAACALKLDLADTDKEIRIIPGDAYYESGKMQDVLDNEGTKIIMKSSRHLKEIISLVAKGNLLSKANLVYKVGHKDEKIFRNDEILHLPEDFFLHAYMSILIIEHL